MNWSKLTPRRNIVITFGIEKLEWCSYQIVKNFEDTCMFTRESRQNTRTWRTDGRTDRHTDTARRIGRAYA